jgi:hypothetical protein
MDFGMYQYNWHSEAYTHVAARVVKFVNNATNVTRTSTILGTDFVLPTALSNVELVSDLVITTELNGVNYTLYAFLPLSSR